MGNLALGLMLGGAAVAGGVGLALLTVAIVYWLT